MFLEFNLEAFGVFFCYFDFGYFWEILFEDCLNFFGVDFKEMSFAKWLESFLDLWCESCGGFCFSFEADVF